MYDWLRKVYGKLGLKGDFVRLKAGSVGFKAGVVSLVELRVVS